MSQDTALASCAYCPGTRAADGTTVDRRGDTVGVCLECLLLIWDQDWAGLEQKVYAFLGTEWTHLERLRHSIHARRVARRWTCLVRWATTGSTPREIAQAGRRRLVRGCVHTLTLRPEQRPGDSPDAFVAASWRDWLKGWILRPAPKGAKHG